MSAREHLARQRVRAWGWAPLALVAGYVVLFVMHCRLDDAPPAWDEAYLLQYPTLVQAAWHRDGLVAALRAFFGTRFMKPPLSMMGTLVPLLLFGTGSLSCRLDNLVVVVVTTVVLGRLLARHLPAPWAATFALGILVSPYALQFARIEMAELYVWAVLVVFLTLVLDGDDGRSRARSAAVGATLGAGLLAKLSFPLLACGPTAWALVRLVRGGRRDGDLARRLGNVGVAAVAGVATFVPFGAYNWKRMWRHLRDQYGWAGAEYRLGDPLSLDYAARYFHGVVAWLGSLWLALAAALALLALVAAGRGIGGAGRAAADRPSGVVEPGWRGAANGAVPWVPLVATVLVNLAYCYFHPVPEPRFVLGALLAFQLLVALGLGSLLDARLAHLVLVPFGLLLLANSYLPGGRPVLDSGLPLLGAVPEVVEPPATAPDLRDAILAQVADDGAPATIGLAGDHPRLNSDNLLLRALERGLPVGVRQVAYMTPTLPLAERVRHCGAVTLWVVILPADDGRGTSWASRDARPMRAYLEARPARFRRLDWRGDLADGTTVVVYRGAPPGQAWDG